MVFYSVFDDSCHSDQYRGGIFTIFEGFSPEKQDPPLFVFLKVYFAILKIRLFSAELFKNSLCSVHCENAISLQHPGKPKTPFQDQNMGRGVQKFKGVTSKMLTYKLCCRSIGQFHRIGFVSHCLGANPCVLGQNTFPNPVIPLTLWHWVRGRWLGILGSWSTSLALPLPGHLSGLPVRCKTLPVLRVQNSFWSASARCGCLILREVR